MPITDFQRSILLMLAANRDQSSYLAGGAAQNLAPNSQRFSYDLDYFQDSVDRVAQAFEADSVTLTNNDLALVVELSQPGFIRARVTSNDGAVIVEWLHDTAWRFFPTVEDEVVGYRLHDIDLAVNKTLALVGRNEPRDLLDTLVADRDTLTLGALLWAATGKDPGYTPLGLLELLRRKRMPMPEELARLNLVEPADPVELKSQWLRALQAAEEFVQQRPGEELGCLYWNTVTGQAVSDNLDSSDVMPHFGQLYGVLPTIR